MLFLLVLLAVPIAYVAVLVRLVVRKSRTGIATSLVFFSLAVATGFWAIVQSRSSTAGIGIIVLPLFGAAAGFLGLGFERWRFSAEPPRRVVAWMALAGALFIVGFNVREGLRTRSRNQVRDAAQAAHSAEITRNRQLIADVVKQNPARARAYLDSSIRARMSDRAFLIAALPNDSISPGILDTLANSSDMGIALEAVRNPGTRAATLARVYREKSYPDYFYQALAAHRNTPPEILRSLYRNPGVISTLDIWLAGNPATPMEVLRQIARTTNDRSVVAQMLENPALDCTLLGLAGDALMKRLDRDAEDAAVMRVTELVPTVCPSGKSE